MTATVSNAPTVTSHPFPLSPYIYTDAFRTTPILEKEKFQAAMRNQGAINIETVSFLPYIEFDRIFHSFDRDGDGRISATELQLCMAAAAGEHISVDDAEALVKSVDSDGDGLLDKQEFMLLVHVEEDEEDTTKVLRLAFGMYEMDGEGCITPASLNRMLSQLGSPSGLDECKAMICRFDLNGDGVISFDEFRIMMMA